MAAPGRSNVSRYVNGITTVADNNILADFGMPDPTKWINYFNDFVNYTAADWTITKTEAGAGSATHVLTDINGGALLITNDAADNDNVLYQKVGECFLMSSSKKAFFKARLKVSDATQSDLVVGLQVTDTTSLDVTDGIYFLKADGVATLDVFCRKDATTGSNTAAAIATLVSDTFIELAWYYDGEGSLYYAVDGVVKGSISAAAAYLPDTELTVSFGIQNGEAVAKTMTVDYVFAALER
jgi:hypothetical protein